MTEPTEPTLTAACVNADCPEFEVAKDLSMMPVGFSPVLCGQCGAEIPVDDTRPPADDQ